MGQNSSCSYFGSDPKVFEAEPVKDAQADLTTSEVFPTTAQQNARTALGKPSDMLKTLKAQESRKAASERWAKTKAEAIAAIMADMEQREQLAQQASPGTEPDRFGADERQRALQAIREEEESRQDSPQQGECATTNGVEEADTERTAQVEAVTATEQPTEKEAVVMPSLNGEENKENTQCGNVSEKETAVPLKVEQKDDLDAQAREAKAAERKAVLDEFLAKNGFDGVSNKRRRTLRPSIYPLHLAAEKGDAQLIGLLIEAGADKLQKDSSGRTAQEVARKKNRKGSHDEALATLA